MGRKRHAENSVCGKGKLSELVEEVFTEDGRRYGGKTTHKGLAPKAGYKKPKHKGRFFDC